MLQVIDNFLSNNYAELLENFCKTEVSWRLDESVSGVNEYTSPNYKRYNAPGANYDELQYGFGHWALDPRGNQSPAFEKVLPLLYFLEEKSGIVVKDLYRIRLALSTSIGKQVQHLPHVDLTEPHKVLLYYVNDSDGDTFLFNEKWQPGQEDPIDYTIQQRVTPKKNRAVIFDGLTYHNSSKPVNNVSRYVINIDFN